MKLKLVDDQGTRGILSMRNPRLSVVRFGNSVFVLCVCAPKRTQSTSVTCRLRLVPSLATCSLMVTHYLNN